MGAPLTPSASYKNLEKIFSGTCANKNFQLNEGFVQNKTILIIGTVNTLVQLRADMTL